MRRPYSLKILWHGRNRFLPAILAVSFSAVLIAVQFGVLLGTLAVTSRPIDHAAAQIWVGIRDMPSIELGHPDPRFWLYRVQGQPEVEDVEGYLTNSTTGTSRAAGSLLHHRRGWSVLAGRRHDLTPEMRTLLTEPGAWSSMRPELDRLGLEAGVGETAEIMGHKVRVVGWSTVSRVFGGLMSFVPCKRRGCCCSMYRPDEIQYLRGSLPRQSGHAGGGRAFEPQVSGDGGHSHRDFSLQTRLYWLTRTRSRPGPRVDLGAGSYRWPGDYQSNLVRGHSGFAARIRRAARRWVCRGRISALVLADRSGLAGGRGHLAARRVRGGAGWPASSAPTFSYPLASGGYDSGDDGHRAVCPD